MAWSSSTGGSENPSLGNLKNAEKKWLNEFASGFMVDIRHQLVHNGLITMVSWFITITRWFGTFSIYWE